MDPSHHERRPLTRVGGPVRMEGEPAAARALADALRVRPEGAGGPWATHGFHPYPARAHPATAARLIERFTFPGSTVCDPMCGSGTILIEALCAGHPTIGSDLNPVAIDVARIATWVASARERKAIVGRSRTIAGAVRSAAGEHEGPVPLPDPAAYPKGVAADLAALHAAIARERDPRLRLAFLVVASGILTRVSTRESETSPRRVERTRGEAAVWWRFARKCTELSARLQDLARRVPHRTPAVTLAVADARDPVHLADASVDFVCTSPPYPNTYDYAAIHADRLAWLGHDPEPFRAGEIGARRDFARGPAAVRRWEVDGRAVLRAFRRILKPGGRAVMLVGDAGFSGRPLRHDAAVQRWAADTGLRVVAQASQEFPSVGPRMRAELGGATKREHAILLAKD